MADGDLRDQISRLEADIEEFAESIDRSRKVILVSKVAIAAGAIWMFVVALGAVRFDPMAMISAIAAVVGGVVVLGSNRSTLKQSEASMKAAEARRAELIDTIDLRVVGDRRNGS
jgi:hypothetical protein